MSNVKMAVVALAAFASVVACQKDDAEPGGNSTLTKLRAKWNVQKLQMDFPGDELDSTYTGVSSDYVDFRADNKVYSQIDGEKDTSAYVLVNDQTLVVDGDTAKITSLTGSQLVIKETYTSLGDTSVITTTLAK